MALTNFTIIGRSMRARLFSTATTVATVAVAVGLMLTLLSMRDAGRQAFERGSGNMHLLVSAEPSPLTAVLNCVFYANAPARPIPWKRFRQIADDPRIAFAVPIQQGDSFRGFPVVATTGEFFSKFQPEEGVAWKFERGAVFAKDFEAVLGAQVARETGLGIGDTISLTHGTSAAREAHVHDHFKIAVAGVLGPTGSSHDRAVFTSLESAWIIHADEKHRREHGHSHGDDHHHHDEEIELTDADRLVTGIYIRAAAAPVMPQVAAELRKDPTLTVASPTGEIRRLFTIVSNIDQVFVGIAAVVMASSGIAIMLAMYNSMEGRRRQIAVLRVLGCSRGRVFGLVLTEAALVGAMGALAGAALAVAGAWIVSGVLKQRLGLVVHPVFAPDWVAAVGVATVVLGALAGLIPAAMAYRTSVANNLKPMG